MPNILIEAGPGCGKTHTLVDCYSYSRATNLGLWKDRHQYTNEQLAIYEWYKTNIPPSQDSVKGTVYITYTTSLRDDIQRKCHRDAKAYTAHGVGYAYLMKQTILQINENRDKQIVEKITGLPWSKIAAKREWQSTYRHLEAIKQELLPLKVDSFNYVHEKYADLGPWELHPRMVEQSQELVAQMKTLDKKLGIDHIDQIWLPVMLCKKPIFHVGFIDEVQDFSVAALTLCRKLCKNLIMTGDPRQSIMGFTGADQKVFDVIRGFIDQEFPLKESFRLPPNLVNRLNIQDPTARLRTKNTVPGIEARMTYAEAAEHLRSSGAMVIARTNVSLIRFSLYLAKQNISSRILGDRLYKGLLYLLGNYKNVANAGALAEALGEYKDRIAPTMKGISRETFEDKVDCIINICKSLNYEDSVEMVKTILKNLFAEKKVNITLCTIHKAKGLEHHCVMILDPPVPSSRAESEFEQIQEHNAEHVALSRSKKDLYEVYQQ